MEANGRITAWVGWPRTASVLHCAVAHDTEHAEPKPSSMDQAYRQLETRMPLRAAFVRRPGTRMNSLSNTIKCAPYGHTQTDF